MKINYLTCFLGFSFLLFVASGLAQNPWVSLAERPSTLFLEEDRIQFETNEFLVNLVRSSQTIASLRPKDSPSFDFTPGDSLKVRSSHGLYHLGDLNIRLRSGNATDWISFSSAQARHRVKEMEVTADQLAGADMRTTFPDDFPLTVLRYWEQDNGQLILRFVLKNESQEQIEVGALGIPLIFNNILSGSLDETHANNVFSDPYIGMDAGFLQVTRLTGRSPSLLVLPLNLESPFEAYRPLTDDPTPRGITFEGFHEWMMCSRAYADKEWKGKTQWNEPTSFFLKPGEKKEVGLKFVIAGEPAGIEQTLIENKMPVTTAVPGYVLPTDVQASLFLRYPEKIVSISSVPEGHVKIKRSRKKYDGGIAAFELQGNITGRTAIHIRYADGLLQTIAYKVIKPESEVVNEYGRFLYNDQWFDDENDIFQRGPSIISYDNNLKKQITQENRAWIAGLSDEAGAGSWLGAAMKQYLRPDKTQVVKLQRFMDNTLWGKIQYASGDLKYGVKKSLFYYEPDSMPAGTYDPKINFKTWSAWPLKEANSPGRSYNYPHVAAAWWIQYRLGRYYQGLLPDSDWKQSLRNAGETALAMVRLAPYYAQFGQMEGTIFYKVLRDLKEEGMSELASSLEEVMKKRTIHWSSLNYPFGSEMPWDSTGQEEVYIWSLYFGYYDKADITLNAILGYMPSIPGWAYNGNARRYWDFQYAGKKMGIERMIHHYGSALNALPVLKAYRYNADNFYLLKVGYGGYLGAISNIDENGFAPVAFHSFPSIMENDGYSGDYGSGFLGYALNSATYLTNHPDFGWLSFGGNLSVRKNEITVVPTTAGKAKLFIAPENLWITLDAGGIEYFKYNTLSGEVELFLEKAGTYNSRAYLSFEQTEIGNTNQTYHLSGSEYRQQGSKYVIELGKHIVKVKLVR